MSHNECKYGFSNINFSIFTCDETRDDSNVDTGNILWVFDECGDSFELVIAVVMINS